MLRHKETSRITVQIKSVSVGLKDKKGQQTRANLKQFINFFKEMVNSKSIKQTISNGQIKKICLLSNKISSNQKPEDIVKLSQTRN